MDLEEKSHLKCRCTSCRADCPTTGSDSTTLVDEAQQFIERDLKELEFLQNLV